MTEHPRELLPLIAEGLMPDDKIRAHIADCDPCRSALDSLIPLDLGYVWNGLRSELDAPAPSILERALGALGLDPAYARFAAVTPTLRPAWILASLGVFVMALVLTLTDSSGLSPILLVAPAVAAAVVAFSYGPSVEPAYEIVTATPLSPITALLVRLAGVLSINSVFVAAADFFSQSGHGTLAWFLPMTAVALLSAVVAIRTQPITGAVTGIALWCFLVVTAVSVARSPAGVLWGGTSQVLYAVVATVCLTTLIQWVRGGTRLSFDRVA